LTQTTPIPARQTRMDIQKAILYHAVTRSDWDAHFDGTRYDTPDRQRTGFIHLSFAHQVEATLERFFSDVPNVLIVVVDPDLLTDLRCEDLYGHGTFPHLYGPIPVAAIIRIEHAETRNPHGN
jgi:glutathione S-transferase